MIVAFETRRANICVNLTSKTLFSLEKSDRTSFIYTAWEKRDMTTATLAV